MSSDALTLRQRGPQSKCPNCDSRYREPATECDCGYNFSTGELGSASIVGKRFKVRMFAYLLDLVIYLAIYYVASFLLGFIIALALVLLGRTFSVDNQSAQNMGLVNGVILSIFYFWIFEWLYGATPAKLLLGLRVVQTSGEQCRSGAAFIRALLRYVDSFFFALPAYVSMNHPLYQRIGDKAAKTIVVGSHNPAIRKHRSAWRFVLASAAYLALVVGLVVLLLVGSLR